MRYTVCPSCMQPARVAARHASQVRFNAQGVCWVAPCGTHGACHAKPCPNGGTPHAAPCLSPHCQHMHHAYCLPCYLASRNVVR